MGSGVMWHLSQRREMIIEMDFSWTIIGSCVVGCHGRRFLNNGIVFVHKQKKVASDWYGNVIFIFIMTWKLSVIIFQFKIAVANPMTIIYFNGGTKGYWLGIAGAIIYTIFMKRKLMEDDRYFNPTLAWILTISAYELVIGILNEGAVWLTLGQFAINLVFLFLIIFKKEKSQWQVQLLILFTCIQGLVYSIKGEVFSVPMATYGLLTVFFSFWLMKRGDN